jgi:hypothetical protein
MHVDGWCSQRRDQLAGPGHLRLHARAIAQHEGANIPCTRALIRPFHINDCPGGHTEHTLSADLAFCPPPPPPGLCSSTAQVFGMDGVSTTRRLMKLWCGESGDEGVTSMLLYLMYIASYAGQASE